MTLFRWLGTAMLTLATAGAVHAQTASFSTILFGGDVEELPAAQRAEINMLPAFVAECLNRWQDMFQAGNYQEADRLAAIANRLDPTNPKVQHARVLTEFMQALAQKHVRLSMGELSLGGALNCGSAIVRLTSSCQEAGGCAATGAAQNVGQTLSTPSTGECPGCPGQCPSAALSNEDIIIRFIQNNVAPKSWQCAGGTGTMKYYPQLKAFVICQTLDVQEEVQKLLVSLRPIEKELKDVLVDVRETQGGLHGRSNVANPECPCDKDCGCCNSVLAVLNFLAATANSCANGTCPCPVFGQANNRAQEVRAITGLTPAGTLTTDLGIPVNRRSFDNLSFGYPSTPGADGGISFAPIIMMHPFQEMPMPANGVFPSPPMPMQALQDLARIRQTALDNAMAAAYASAPPLPPVNKRKVHLATPHFEANCDRLTNGGDSNQMLLEGDVDLTCQRNGQTIRIQGQRVRVNLADGTFTVEAAPETQPSETGFRGVPWQQGYQLQPATYAVPMTPVQRYRQVSPLHVRPEVEQSKPDEDTLFYRGEIPPIPRR
jgi:hypothetical protein